MQERRASLLDEDSSRVGKLHTDNPSIIASEQAKSMLFFDLGDLSAERRLGEVQSVGGFREVQLFAQGNDCVQVAYFDVGEHGSKLRSRVGDTESFVLSFVRETTSGYEFGTRPVLKSFFASQQIFKSLASETRSSRRFSGVVSCRPT